MISYDEICEILLKVEPSIRYVGILDGEKITFRKRAGLYSLLNTSENVKSATHALMRWQSRECLQQNLGCHFMPWQNTS